MTIEFASFETDSVASGTDAGRPGTVTGTLETFTDGTVGSDGDGGLSPTGKEGSLDGAEGNVGELGEVGATGLGTLVGGTSEGLAPVDSPVPLVTTVTGMGELRCRL